MDLKFCDPHISGNHLSYEDSRIKPDMLKASQWRAGMVSLCEHMYQLGSVTDCLPPAAAKCEIHSLLTRY